ncbi:MAG TPA: chorismate synthase [bacterium]|nr:chorismate synthase [bacterium]
MPGNSFGELFRITTWGESHGGAVGVVIDGCPPRLKLSEALIQRDLDRRKPGQNELTTERAESDAVQILSGVFQGKTLGTPISLLVWNEDARSEDYLGFSRMFRPGHADYTYEQKYGVRNWQGGGRASARETVGRVAAGAIAKLILQKEKISILAYTKSVGRIEAAVNPATVTREAIDKNLVRCPVQAKAREMEKLITTIKAKGDSIGGIVECVIRGCPVGLGEPVFDKLSADLAKACLSIPATKGFEIGDGFASTRLYGSNHNDPFQATRGKITTKTNHAGGILGGISSGQDIILRIAFKPTSTIGLRQQTVTTAGKNTMIEARGRHDPCVLPRAVPVVEAMVAITLSDHLLRYKAQCL